MFKPFDQTLGRFPTRAEPITRWRESERIAAEWLRSFGYPTSEVTGRGSDLGVDVRAPKEAIAQVKYTHAIIGRQHIQLLIGARHPDCNERMFFFSRSAFHKNAILWAEVWSVALFRFDDFGNPFPENKAALQICRDVGYTRWRSMRPPFDRWVSQENAALRREPIISKSGKPVRDRRSATAAALSWAVQCGYLDATAADEVTVVAKGLVILVRFRHDHTNARDEIRRIGSLPGNRVRAAVSWCGVPKGARKLATNEKVALFECNHEGDLACVNDVARTLFGEQERD